MEDAEKYEAALHAGWRVYRIPGGWVSNARRDYVFRPRVLTVLRRLLDIEEPEEERRSHGAHHGSTPHS